MALINRSYYCTGLAFVKHTFTFYYTCVRPKRNISILGRCVNIRVHLETCMCDLTYVPEAKHIYAATRCNTLQHTATHCNTLQHIATHCNTLQQAMLSSLMHKLKQEVLDPREREETQQVVAVCCSVLQCVAVCCSVLQRVAACCSVLQYVAVCCSVLQYVAV